ncbi:MAG: hypothetical protein ACM3ZE_14280 [Myxococcales bacterium]
MIKHLAPRWFLMRDVHAKIGSLLLQPRWAMSLLRGPMTRNEIRKARELPVLGSVVPIPKSMGVQTNP